MSARNDTATVGLAHETDPEAASATPSTGAALTIEQAAAELGLSVNTVRNYVRQRRLSPVPGTEGRGRRSLFHPSDLDAVRGLKEAYDQRRREKRGAILASGSRPCNGPCGRVLPLEAFAECRSGIAGRDSRCKECERAAARQYAQRPGVREKRIAYKREYRKANRERVKAYKREWQRRVIRQRGTSWRNLRRYFNRRYHLETALADGKRSPVCRRHGFAVVRMPGEAERFRAARLDKPFGPGERAVAHYVWNAGLARWIVLTPPLGASAEPRLLRLLMDREGHENRGAKVGTAAPAKEAPRVGAA